MKMSERSWSSYKSQWTPCIKEWTDSIHGQGCFNLNSGACNKEQDSLREWCMKNSTLLNKIHVSQRPHRALKSGSEAMSTMRSGRGWNGSPGRSQMGELYLRRKEKGYSFWL